MHLYKEFAMRNMIQRVAAIHDISGFGKVSLTVVIPTLSAMGIQVCPLPTAVLSAHTGFRDFTFFDLTDEMEKIIAHWKSLGIKFDAIYSGFLGSVRQIDIVASLIDNFRSQNQIVLVDPVMGDDGALYETMGQDMIDNMRRLMIRAHIITPNLTELAFLAGERYAKDADLEKIKSWMKKLSRTGPRYVVATSVPVQETGQFSVLGFDSWHCQFWRVKNNYIPVHYSGTGDTFASVLLGCMMKGENFPASIDTAVQFVSRAIHRSFGFDHGRQEGPAIEAVLNTLQQSALSYSYEKV